MKNNKENIFGKALSICIFIAITIFSLVFMLCMKGWILIQKTVRK